MNVEEHPPRWFEFVETFLNKHAVGTQIDVPLARQNLSHQAADFRIDHGLATADRYHRRPAFIDRIKALLHRELFLNCFLVFADAAAARARQVAGVQRLEHHHQRKFVRSPQPLPGTVSTQAGRQT